MTDAATAPQPLLRIVVAARYPSVRAGLRAMLDAAEGLSVVGEVAALGEDVEFDVNATDVLVIDLDDDADVEWLRDVASSVPLVLLAGEPSAFRELLAQEPRPRGCLLKGATADEMTAAVAAVAQGLVVIDPAVARMVPTATYGASNGPSAPSPLTRREQDVLELVAEGLPNKQIAPRLGISEHTVKFHVGAILGKLGAASRTEAVTLAVRAGLLPL
jgi:DNA-binding NarL/FixJ family response regulator